MNKNHHTTLGFEYTDTEEQFYRQAIRNAAEFMKHYGKGRQPRTISNYSAYESLRSPDGMENLTVCNLVRCDRKLMCEHYANRAIAKKHEGKYYIFNVYKCYSVGSPDRPQFKPLHTNNKMN